MRAACLWKRNRTNPFQTGSPFTSFFYGKLTYIHYIIGSSCLCQSCTTNKTPEVLFVYTVKVFPPKGCFLYVGIVLESVSSTSKGGWRQKAQNT